MVARYGFEDKKDYVDSHCMRPYWARTTTETLMGIEYVKELVMTLVEHGSKIKLMSMGFYKKGKWPIHNKHGWKIREVT